MKTTLDLHTNWRFRQVSKTEWYPATVPGCVHTDLLANQLIDDPFYRDNESKLQWIEGEDWEYRTTFRFDGKLMASQHIDLVCDGLDTFATIYLNDEKILTTDNMFRTWRVDVKTFLRAGDNELRIVFESATEKIKPILFHDERDYPAQLDAIGTRPHTRKAQYHFGWDWGPRFVTCGIWRPIRLEAWDNLRIESVHITQQHLSDSLAVLNLDCEIQSTNYAEIDVEISVFEYGVEIQRSVVEDVPSNSFDCSIDIEEPHRWWPAGYGDQFLYEICVELLYGGEPVDQQITRIGLRTLDVRRQPDEFGQSFEFVINDVPIFAKDGNWIPADSFPSRVSKERYRGLLQSCVDANMNMLRVWGGGIYESDDFYDLCDELGILVWQDFMFACAMYPAHDEFLTSVEFEVIDCITRLRNHACLAVWCGNNENEWGWLVWGLKEKHPQHMWENYKTLNQKLLPRLCEEYDPTRLYWPSSPSSNFEHPDPNSDDIGDVHYWSVWHNAEPFQNYCTRQPRFISEYGFQSFPMLESVKKFTTPDDYNIESPVMLHHQKNDLGNQLIREYMLRDYPEPKDFESFLYVSQILQAEGIKIGAEHFRRLRPRCMGSLYWQINDCWPVASWSSIDYYGTWKALHYAAKRFYAPVLVSPVFKDGHIDVTLVSDLPDASAGTLELCIMDFSGNPKWHKVLKIDIAPLSSHTFYSINLTELTEWEPDTFLLCRFRSENYFAENTLFFYKPKNLNLPHPTIRVECQSAKDGYVVNLLSDVLALHVDLTTDVHGRFDDNFYHIVPNEKKSVFFSTEEKMSKNELKSRIRVRSLVDAFLL